jgi:uridine kinase
LDGVDLILFEGMYTLSNNSLMNLRSYADLGIYMETTVENICQWKWEREKKKTVSRTLEQFENHMALIFEDFVRFVYPTKQHADWVIYADDRHEVSIVCIESDIK